MAIVENGTEIIYHGSLAEYDGETFTVLGKDVPTHYTEEYPDGVAYALGRGGFAGPYLSNVRRTSFTVVGEPE